MKAVKWVLIVLGAVCLGIGLYMVIRLSMDLGAIVDAAGADRSVDGVGNPARTVWIAGGVALAAGALLGLGIGLPRWTLGSVRRETLEGAAAQRERSIRENALRRSGRASEDSSAGEASELPGEPGRPQLEYGEEGLGDESGEDERGGASR